MCPLCNFTTDDKVKAWRRDPLAEWTRDDDNDWLSATSIVDVKPSDLIWEPEHLLTRVLDQTIKYTYSKLPKWGYGFRGKFIRVMKTSIPGWTEKCSLTVKQVQ